MNYTNKYEFIKVVYSVNWFLQWLLRVCQQYKVLFRKHSCIYSYDSEVTA